MAKKKASASTALMPASDEQWRVEDALQTLRRAGEIVGDKKLMAKVKKLAGERAQEMTALERQAAQLAKAGRISPKAMAKLKSR